MTRMLKRAMDILVSLTLLLLLSPVTLVAAVAIYWSLGTPVLFRQVRPGFREKAFAVIKFRTMKDAVGPDGQPLPDGERLTAVGRFMRKSSLDEIPQLLNVLRGEMSLVGPRPLLMRYLPYYTERERLRFTVPPGITGWAQVHGRNQARWDVRLENDIWYVMNWNLWLDIKILCLTAWKVFARSGIVVDPHAVMLNLDEERAHGNQIRSS